MKFNRKTKLHCAKRITSGKLSAAMVKKKFPRLGTHSNRTKRPRIEEEKIKYVGVSAQSSWRHNVSCLPSQWGTLHRLLETTHPRKRSTENANYNDFRTRPTPQDNTIVKKELHILLWNSDSGFFVPWWSKLFPAKRDLIMQVYSMFGVWPFTFMLTDQIAASELNRLKHRRLRCSIPLLLCLVDFREIVQSGKKYAFGKYFTIN